MRYILLAMLLLATHRASALTWDFDDGTTWGWTARESALSTDRGSVSTVYSEVADGVWRIAPVPGAQRPAIQLRSPWIGEDSALFDRVTLRLRIIHDRPTEGRLVMEWFNTEYKRLIDASRGGYIQFDIQSPFLTGRLQFYPTDWEHITIDLRALEAFAASNPEEGIAITWQDTLFEFHLDLDLNDHAEGPADHPEFLEVDWIQLTGAEELLLGELQPQEVVVEAGLPNALFAAPDFFPVGEGIEVVLRPQYNNGTLGDIDGDGAVDLVAVWTRSTAADGSFLPGQHWGWTVAFNDGWGGFVSTHEVIVGPTTVDPRVAGSDFDGDGRLDLMAFVGSVELWHNRGRDGFETILQLPDVWLVGLADSDGDGDVDLLVVENDDKSPHVILWYNDGAAGFVRSDRVALDSEERLVPWLLAGQSLGEAVRLLWNRVCSQPPGTWQLTRPWAASEEPPIFFEAAVTPCELHLLTDLDGDGGVELVGSSNQNLQFDPTKASITYHGLALWRVDASGMVVRHTLLGPQTILPHRAIASDLNGDGLQDLAVVDGNLATGPALVVLVGQRDGIPVVEGRYRLPGTGGEVFASDLNGDGATDLAVLGRSIEGGPGGAFVFLNQGVPATAIAAETVATPAAFTLGANYPNPFNPATTIPLVVPSGVKDVDLTIYNVLGQPMQRIWTGPLPAGEHLLTWDGRDAHGHPVAAGVYVYRLQVGDQTRTRKMVKLE